MASLYTKVKKYLEANSKTWEDTKVSLQNNSDGNGDFIASWSYDIAEPTDEQLATYETDGNTEEALNTVYNNRKTEYPNHNDCIHALLDGGDTLTDLQNKRQAVKTKYPKPE